MNILCVGEAMVELSLTGGQSSANVGFAGDTLNTAVYLQRTLNAGNDASEHSVSYLTALGHDAFSAQMVSLMASENIGTDLIQYHSDRVPGLYAINTDDAGERSFTYWRDQSAARALFSTEIVPELSELNRFDLIYYSAISLAILPDAIKQRWLEFLHTFRNLPGKQVAFDSNYRPRLWDSPAHAREYIEAAYRQCDVALPSMDDEMEAFGDTDRSELLHRLNSYGVRRGVLKCGVDGPVDLADTSTVYDLPVQPHVVDSTAAGDSFNGAYLAGLMCGKPSAACIEQGHNCARRVIGFRGAIVDPELWNNDAQA